jgi:uncharacterized protein YndB with AHSA1/START domain
MTPPRTRDLRVTRVLDAPLELAWRLWAEPDWVMRWWGPAHYTCPSCQMDFREGGTTIVCMRSPEGHDQHSAWHYTRIVPHERIEFTQHLAQADGSRMDPAAAGLSPDFPENTRTVVEFKALGAQTELTITEYAMPTGFMGEMAELGLNQMMDKIAAVAAEVG